MKTLQKEPADGHNVDADNTYYVLTLDPTVKEHRIIALLTEYTSKHDECSFYEPSHYQDYCNIAPKFRVLWRDCGGKCFTKGLTCPIILEHLEELEEGKTKEPRNAARPLSISK